MEAQGTWQATRHAADHADSCRRAWKRYAMALRDGDALRQRLALQALRVLGEIR